MFKPTFEEFDEIHVSQKKSSILVTYLFSALFFGVFSVFVSGAIDIAIGDTYFVVSNMHLLFAYGLLNFIFWVWLKRLFKKGKILAPFWIVTHQVVSFALILGTIYIFNLLSKIEPGRFHFESNEYKKILNLNYLLSITLVLFLLVQFFFILVILIRAWKEKY